MSYEVAKVGELIIKPEYRKDMRDYVKDWKGIFLGVKYWWHKDYRLHWAGKYEIFKRILG